MVLPSRSRNKGSLSSESEQGDFVRKFYVQKIARTRQLGISISGNTYIREGYPPRVRPEGLSDAGNFYSGRPSGSQPSVIGCAGLITDCQ